MLPPELRRIEVTPPMFQTRQHHDAWKAGRPLLTQRPKRWRVPARWEAIMWRHYGRRCVHCRTTENLTIGHIVPVQFGGSNEPCNIRPECLTHNLEQWTPACAALARELAREQAA